MIKNWRWFISKTLRDAVELHKQVIKLLAAQRDLLKPSRADELQGALDALKTKLTGPVDKAAVLDETNAMMIIADRVLLPYPDPKARDLVEMFLVVAVLVLAFRTFFFQPFKIPTGSMQPTLYGITIENLMDHTGTGKVEQGTLTAIEPTFEPQDLGRTVTFANGKQATIIQFKNNQRVKLSPPHAVGEQNFTVSFNLRDASGQATDWLRGYTYHSLKAEGHWQLIQIDPPKTIFPFVSNQNFLFKNLDTGNTIKKNEWGIAGWGPPLDSHQQPIIGGASREYGQPRIGDEFSKGDYVYKLRVKTGDHLFVNRITFNFRRPRRGDICVFSTKGVPVPRGPNGSDLFYIKRLVALAGESISIGRDRHIRINGRRIDANDPGFEFLYDFPIDFATINGGIIRINGRNIDTNCSAYEFLKNPQIDFQTTYGQILSIPRYRAVNSAYSGHINNGHPTATYNPPTAPHFKNSETSMEILPNRYLMFGDNTINSSDSRVWGQLPMRNVIGKSSFVYWPPLSPRFGWSHR